MAAQGVIKVEFRGHPGLYRGVFLEIRKRGTQIRFYEVNHRNKKETCLKKDTVKWLVKHGSLPRTKLMKQALKGDHSIFTT